MRDREEQQQKAQLHRLPSARRSCDERSSAHNYRDRILRTHTAKRPPWSIFPGAMTCTSIWLFAERVDIREIVVARKEKGKGRRTLSRFEISRYRRFLLPHTFCFSFDVSSSLHVSIAANVIEIIASKNFCRYSNFFIIWINYYIWCFTRFLFFPELDNCIDVRS